MTRKEKKREYDKAYRAKNKEKRAAQNAAYYLNNIDEQKVKRKVYRDNNKEAAKSRAANQRLRDTLPYNVVYCIPNYDRLGNNYAGVTNNTTHRMHKHKHLGKHFTEDMFILDIVVDRAEALKSEALFHAQGYHGINETMFNNKIQ